MFTQLYVLAVGNGEGLGVGAKGLAPAPSSVMVGDFAMLFTIHSFSSKKEKGQLKTRRPKREKSSATITKVYY